MTSDFNNDTDYLTIEIPKERDSGLSYEDFVKHNMFLKRIDDDIDPWMDDEEQPIMDNETRMNMLEGNVCIIKDTLVQLAFGLFNQTTQEDTLNRFLNKIYNLANIDKGGVEQERNFPTTRQGDKNEEEITILKQRIVKLEETVNALSLALKKK